MKRIVFLLSGLISLLVGTGAAFFLWQYIVGGAGLQYSVPWISDVGVLVGLAHVIGFTVIAALGFALGVVWLAEGLVSQPMR